MSITEKAKNNLDKLNSLDMSYLDDGNLIHRACVLQAKWNGTTYEEEYAHYKSNSNKTMKELDDDQTEANKAKESANSTLPKNARDACRYFNKHIKNIPNPCDGNTCNKNCPNCTYKCYREE